MFVGWRGEGMINQHPSCAWKPNYSSEICSLAPKTHCVLLPPSNLLAGHILYLFLMPPLFLSYSFFHFNNFLASWAADKFGSLTLVVTRESVNYQRGMWISGACGEVETFMKYLPRNSNPVCTWYPNMVLPSKMLPSILDHSLLMGGMCKPQLEHP
jgi:hypothetical protein